LLEINQLEVITPEPLIVQSAGTTDPSNLTTQSAASGDVGPLTADQHPVASERGARG